MPLHKRRVSAIVPLLALFAGPLLVAQQSSPPAEDSKFEQIKGKRDRGEKLTAEERDYAQSVMEKRNQQTAAQRSAEYAKDHAARDSTGVAALPDLGKGTYKGETGGLYPAGRNTPPPAHLQAGMKLAREIVPLDAQGHKANEGKIVLLSIGMSNTTQETRSFMELAAHEKEINPKLVIVDGAQGGQTAAITAKPEANYWKVVDERLGESGVTREQVEVVWLKQANAGPKAEFPQEVKKLQSDIVATLHNLHDKFPNLKIAYLSSRIYAGYAASPLNPEPHAYETGFAVKWLIADQIDQKPELNYDPAKGVVRSPWLAWGPYLWADGVKARADGLVWNRENLGPDGTHPSVSGRKKVAEQLLRFLKSDTTARPWFVEKT